MEIRLTAESAIAGLLTVGCLIITSVSETFLLGSGFSQTDIFVYACFLIMSGVGYALFDSESVTGIMAGSMYFFGFQLLWYGSAQIGLIKLAAPDQMDLLFGAITGVLLILMAHQIDHQRTSSEVLSSEDFY